MQRISSKKCNCIVPPCHGFAGSFVWNDFGRDVHLDEGRHISHTLHFCTSKSTSSVHILNVLVIAQGHSIRTHLVGVIVTMTPCHFWLGFSTKQCQYLSTSLYQYLNTSQCLHQPVPVPQHQPVSVPQHQPASAPPRQFLSLHQRPTVGGPMDTSTCFLTRPRISVEAALLRSRSVYKVGAGGFCLRWQRQWSSAYLSGADPGFWSGGAQQSFDPKGVWAQNLLKIGVFPLKLPENCMILKKS